MAQSCIPTVLAMLLCDQVITDAESTKKTLVGLFDSVFASQVPVLYAKGFSIFARLSDVEGKYNFRVDVVFLDEDKALGSVTTKEVIAPNRLGFVELIIVVSGIGFEKYGKYEFQLYANDVYVGRTTLIVAKPPQQGG